MLYPKLTLILTDEYNMGIDIDIIRDIYLHLQCNIIVISSQQKLIDKLFYEEIFPIRSIKNIYLFENTSDLSLFIIASLIDNKSVKMLANIK